jgi:hypothetical protein
MLLSLGILEKWDIGMLVFVHYSNIPSLQHSIIPCFEKQPLA